MPRRPQLDADPAARAALAEAVRAHHGLLDAEEEFDQAMWAPAAPVSRCATWPSRWA